MADERSNGDGYNRSRMVGGIIVLGLGILFLLSNLEILDFGDSWPLILIIVGLSLLVGAFANKKKADSDQIPSA